MRIKKAMTAPKTGAVPTMGPMPGFACGGKVKKMADGGMAGCHNPDNKLPKHAMHTRGRNRGM